MIGQDSCAGAISEGAPETQDPIFLGTELPEEILHETELYEDDLDFAPDIPVTEIPVTKLALSELPIKELFALHLSPMSTEEEVITPNFRQYLSDDEDPDWYDDRTLRQERVTRSEDPGTRFAATMCQDPRNNTLSEEELFRQASGVSMNLGGFRLQYGQTSTRRTHPPSMAEEDEDIYSSTD